MKDKNKFANGYVELVRAGNRDEVRDLLETMVLNPAYIPEQITRNIELANRKANLNYARYLAKAIRDDWALTNPPVKESKKNSQAEREAMKQKEREERTPRQTRVRCPYASS